MIIEPRLKPFENGSKLTLDSINSIIKRIEYAGDLIRRNSPVAGINAFVEQLKNGKLISCNPLYTESQSNVIKLVNNLLPYQDYAATPENGFTPQIIFKRTDFEEIYGKGLYLAVTIKAWGIVGWEYPTPVQSFFFLIATNLQDFFTGYINFSQMPDNWYFSLPYLTLPETSGPTFAIVNSIPVTP